MTTDYNTAGEQYRIVINGETVATFTDIEPAADTFNALSCDHCYRCKNTANCDHCCQLQTWVKES